MKYDFIIKIGIITWRGKFMLVIVCDFFGKNIQKLKAKSEVQI